jgi:hypothetical protein
MTGAITKFWPILFILLLVAGCLLYFKSCHPAPVVNRHPVDSAMVADAAYKKGKLETIAMDSSRADSLQRRIDTLTMERIEQESDLTNRGRIISGTIADYQQAKTIHDTVLIFQTCDTLVQQVEAGKKAVASYALLTDTLLSEMAEHDRIRDSIGASWKGMFLHSDSSNAFLQVQYNLLDSKYGALRRRYNATRTVGKGIAIAAGIILVSAILKK